MEALSFVASGLIILANFMKDAKKMRVFFLIADIIFIVYGVYLKSYSLIILNSVGTVQQIVYLLKMLRPKKTFKIA